MRSLSHNQDEERVERLLAAAARFEPAEPMPADLVRRAMDARRPRRAAAAWRPAVAGACGVLLALALWSHEPEAVHPVVPAPPPLQAAPAVADRSVPPVVPGPRVASSEASAGSPSARAAAPGKRRTPRAGPTASTAPRSRRAAPRRVRGSQPPAGRRAAPPPARWRTYLVHQDTTHVVAPVWLVDRGDDGGVAFRPAVANIPVASGGFVDNADYVEEVP